MSQPIGAVRIDAEEFSLGKILATDREIRTPPRHPARRGFSLRNWQFTAIDPAGSWKPEH
jgi:hypothetical protein